MSSVEYGALRSNEIQPGLPWGATIALTRAAAWESADVANWRIAIHPVRGGGAASITKSPASAVLSNSDKTITLTFSVTGAETDELVSPPEKSAVQIERRVGSEWEPVRQSAGTVAVRHRPGAR